MIKEFLRRLPLFAGMSEEDLDRLSDMAVPMSVKGGDVLIEEGQPGDSMYIVTNGQLEVTKHAPQNEVVLSVRKPGEFIGEMSLLDQAPRMASVTAIEDSKVLMISQFALRQLLACSPSAAMALLQTVTSRLRSTEGMLMQNEKMASLGTLSAGLAHELNNPAAAARRSAGQLKEVLDRWQEIAISLDTLNFEPQQAKTLGDLRLEMASRASSPLMLDPLDRSDKEGEMQYWLEDRGIDEAWDIAPVLVTYGWDPDALEELSGHFSEEQFRVVVPWLSAGSQAYGLLDEVSKSAERISEIVKAVKSYSYLDQAPVQQVNVHDGIENTLIILKHKLKQGIIVHREYDRNLPLIEAYASELNQVWTNLIDNAVDAMKGQGDLTIRTYARTEHVVVEIIDSGPGIPPDIQGRIFDPFFTTKPQGIGTGLGLHIAYNIVVHKHRGEISVKSEPGMTCFQVVLPIELAR